MPETLTAQTTDLMGNQLTDELAQATKEHAVWTLTGEVQRVYGEEARHVSVMASEQADTGRLTADTLRVLDGNFETLLPDLQLVRRACELDTDLRENLAGLADLTSAPAYTLTEEDLGDHLLESPVFVALSRAVNAWLLSAQAPERAGWPYRQDLTLESGRAIVLPSSMDLPEMSVTEFVVLKRRLLADRAERGW